MSGDVLGYDAFSILGSAMMGASRDEIDAMSSRLSESERAAFLSMIAGSRMHSDPGHAVELIAQVPESDERNQTLRSALLRWARSDLPAVLQWLSDLPAGNFRETAVESFALTTVRSEPEIAAGWAASLASDSHRVKTLSRVVSYWLDQDRPAAEAWVAGTSALSEARKAELLSDP